MSLDLSAFRIGFDLSVLAVRFGVAIVLYLFLLQLLLVLRRELKAAARPAQAVEFGRLVVVDPAESGLAPGTAFALAGVTTVGRGPTNSIPIDDAFMSSSHVRILTRDGHWWVEDLGSTNGTLVNQRPIDRPTLVTNGDVIAVGRVRLRLERVSVQP